VGSFSNHGVAKETIEVRSPLLIPHPSPTIDL